MFTTFFSIVDETQRQKNKNKSGSEFSNEIVLFCFVPLARTQKRFHFIRLLYVIGGWKNKM
jgi:hypothetical protein